MASETQQAELQDMTPVAALEAQAVDALRAGAAAARAAARAADMARLERAAGRSLRFVPLLRRVYGTG